MFAAMLEINSIGVAAWLNIYLPHTHPNDAVSANMPKKPIVCLNRSFCAKHVVMLPTPTTTQH